MHSYPVSSSAKQPHIIPHFCVSPAKLHRFHAVSPATIPSCIQRTVAWSCLFSSHSPFTLPFVSAVRSTKQHLSYCLGARFYTFQPQSRCSRVFSGQLLRTASLTSFFNYVLHRILSVVSGTDATTPLGVSFGTQLSAHSTCFR